MSLPNNIRELTSLRFFAAFWVVMFHIHDNNYFLKNLDSSIFTKGYLGVDIFFILSGFILSHVYISSIQSKYFSWKTFLINRIARIYPLHVFMIFAFILLYVGAENIGIGQDFDGMKWTILPWHLLMLHAWGFTRDHAWNFPSWSISAEFFAYLIFPWIAYFSLKFRPIFGIVISVVLLTIAYFISTELFRKPLTGLMFDFGIIRIFFEFLFGISLYILCKNVNFSYKMSKCIQLSAITTILVVAHFNITDIVIVFISGILIFSLAQMSRFEPLSIFNSKYFVFLGEISYSTYMIHFFIELIYVNGLRKLMGIEELSVFMITILVILIWFCSVPSYYLIELRWRNAVRKILVVDRERRSKI